MPKIALFDFKGRVPKVSSKLLPNEFAQTATNCDLRSGNLQAISDLENSSNLGTGTDYRSIYKLGSVWATWTGDIDVVRSLIYQTDNKILYTGDSYPKQTNSTLWADSEDFLRLGIVPPSTALTITLIDVGSGTTDIQATVSYVYTYVSGDGEESAPNTATAAVDIPNNKYVRLTGFTAPAGANKNNITHFNIYRLASGTLGAEYQFLEQVAYTTSTHNDYDAGTGLLDEVSTDVLATEDWIQPDSSLSGLTQFANGMVAGFVDNEVYFCEPFIPYAYPSDYMLSFDSDVVAIAAYNESLIVITETKPYIVSGLDPQTMSVTELPYDQGCVSKNGAVETPEGVVYPSPDGLILVNATSAVNLTEKIFTKKQWAALTPANLIGFYYDNEYYGFFSGTATGFILRNDSIVDLNLGSSLVYGGYIDPTNDKLYLLTKRDTTYYIDAFEDSSSSLTYTYKSKKFYVPYPINYACGKIFGTFGSVTFKFYSDGVLKSTQTITTNSMFRLPSGFLTSEYVEFQLESTATVDAVIIATSTKDLQIV